MCLGVPAKVIEIRRDGEMRIAVVEMGGITLEVLLTLGEEVKPGDYVIVHAGIAISKIDDAELESILKLWKEVIEGNSTV
ncbi:MAG TPA: HypC/HybG/HupF family hydrogenase formation chaperone [Ignisphaera aggregans]|uniref:HypC/HybG/HupF family hydrogenase formation chaperone n=1 Tax=Ignisphaera aggregans TaxID=334771 RepID=A0A833DT61_9CREN|nr:HypC/HybG/HupF family hydrogenase formation chaperone [Ignisphaera aggregans]